MYSRPTTPAKILRNIRQLNSYKSVGSNGIGSAGHRKFFF